MTVTIGWGWAIALSIVGIFALQIGRHIILLNNLPPVRVDNGYNPKLIALKQHTHISIFVVILNQVIDPTPCQL